MSHMIDLSMYGQAYSLNANIEGILIIAVNDTIVFWDLDLWEVYRTVDDMKNIFVIDTTLGGDYLLSGMEDGDFSVWIIMY